MSTMAPELGLKQLEQRIAALDADIASKGEALEARKSELGEQGVTYATIPVEVAAELTSAHKEIDGLKDERIVLSDTRQTIVGATAALRSGNREGEKFARASFYDLVMGSPEYASLTAERLMGGAQIGSMPSIEVVSRDHAVARMTMGLPLFAAATADLDAGIPLDERLFPPVDILRRQIRLLDLVTVGSTDSDTVVYARQTTRTAAAAETALGTAYSEASFDFEQVTANVRDIGHFTTAYRSNIADAGQFDTLVRRQLEEDVVLRLESQMYAGDGAGVNLPGISVDGNIESVTRDTTNETRVDCAHRAITEVRNNFREPTAFMFHPNDYQDILFEKDSSERHLLVPGGYTSAAAAPVQTLWGLPMVVSPVATEGTGLVGYWPDATLWVRSGVALSVSDSHSDYFTKRQVAILAEMRAAFSVQRPGAFCAIELI